MLLLMLGSSGQQIWQKVVNEGHDTKSVLTQLPPPSKNHHSKHFVGEFPFKGFSSSLHLIKSSIENTNFASEGEGSESPRLWFEASLDGLLAETPSPFNTHTGK